MLASESNFSRELLILTKKEITMTTSKETVRNADDDRTRDIYRWHSIIGLYDGTFDILDEHSLYLCNTKSYFSAKYLIDMITGLADSFIQIKKCQNCKDAGL